MINPHNAPLSYLTGVPGWETQVEQQCLRHYAEHISEGGVIVEIGSEFGMSASILRKFSHPSVLIHCVDINKQAPFMSNLRGASLSTNVTPHFMSSLSFFAKNTSRLEANLVFIDGDHTYRGALLDLQASMSIVKKDAYILIHDVDCETNRQPHQLHREVRKAVDQWVLEYPNRLQLIESRDSIVVYRIQE